MSFMNRMANCHNRYQGKFKRVLCVCSAGLLRSPTTAFILASEFGCNTRAAGLTDEFALIPVDDVLLEWADEIVCMEGSQAAMIRVKLGDAKKPVISLDIPDSFEYRDPELMRLIRDSYTRAMAKEEA